MFEPLTPEAALAKVKNFVVGLAPTQDEYAAYAADPSVLRSLIDTWMALPEFEPRMLEMLEFMFQQGAGSDDIGLLFREQNTDIFQQREGRGGVDLETPMRRSFALSAWDIIRDGRPFHEVATTRTFYLNVPLMMSMAYVDATPRDDTNAYVPGYSWLENEYPGLTVTYSRTETVAFADSVDPSSPDYGVFSIGEPDGSAAGTSACDGLDNTFVGRQAIEEVYKFMMGVPYRTTCWSWNGAMANVFDEADRVLRPVRVRLAAPGERPTVFWDLATLRSTDELVLTTEYVGYFGTLGFLTQWTTNDANEFRATANQTLIVGLGRSFDPADGDVSIDAIATDDLHAAPGTVCYGCHVTLDPLRDFFRQSYTYWGSPRIDGMGANESVPAVASFSVDGSAPIEGVGVGALADAIATSPRFAHAWTEKMCSLVNTGRCDSRDDELDRVAEVFASSGHDFRVLLRELLSSPVVTYAERTETWERHGISVGTALRDDFCRRLSSRLRLDDACALRDELDAPPGTREVIRGYAEVISGLSYPRGKVEPDQPTVPTLLGTAATDNLCETIADEFIGSDLLDANERALAIDFLVHELMGVWSGDPRALELGTVLDEHWTEITQQGGDALTALRSTFVLACTAPMTTSTGL